jgi:hypothetical protein
VSPTLCRTIRPIQTKKFGRWGKKFGTSNFLFLKEFGLEKSTTFVCVSEKILIEIFLGHFPRTKEDKRKETILLNSAPFRPSLFKIGQNSTAELSDRSTFYSALFDLCGRTIGQLAMLRELSPLSFSLVDRCPLWMSTSTKYIPG